jgi:hypothetical protein
MGAKWRNTCGPAERIETLDNELHFSGRSAHARFLQFAVESYLNVT